VQDSSTISAPVIDDSSTMTSTEEDTDNIGILGTDPGLEPYKDHFKYRVRKYAEQKALFEKYEGGLEEFAQGDQFLLYMKSATFLLSSFISTWKFDGHRLTVPVVVSPGEQRHQPRPFLNYYHIVS
jgi:hypothetical protein